jgi:hypothetical protein
MEFLVRVFLNESHRFSDYRHGDPLVASRLNPFPMTDFGDNYPGDTEWERTCEAVFGLLNRDERPNGLYERSLSVGDIVALECRSQPWVGHVRVFGVAPFGFEELPLEEKGGLNEPLYPNTEVWAKVLGTVVGPE